MSIFRGICCGQLTSHASISNSTACSPRAVSLGHQLRDGRRIVAIRPRFSVNTADAVIAAAVAGLGVARVMSYQAARAVADQRLVALLRQDAVDPLPVHLVHAPQPLLPVKLRAFLDFVAPRLKNALDQIEDTYA